MNYENAKEVWGPADLTGSPKREPAINGLLGRFEEECGRLEQNVKALAARLDGVTSPDVEKEKIAGDRAIERVLPPLLQNIRNYTTNLQQCNALLESVLSRLEI